jgi:uncharacterized membrane protein YvbJ
MFSLVIYDIYYYILTQKDGDCDFFMWADNRMTSYEKRLEEHMRDIEEGRRADIEKVEKMFWAAVVVIILGIVIYFSSYSSSEVSYLMLE